MPIGANPRQYEPDQNTQKRNRDKKDQWGRAWATISLFHHGYDYPETHSNRKHWMDELEDRYA